MKQRPTRLLVLLTTVGIVMFGLFSSGAAQQQASVTNGLIVFRSGSDLYTIDPDHPEAGMTQLTHSPVNDRYPSWSPTADRIVFRRVTSNGGYGIFTINHDGTNLQRLTSGNTGVYTQPAWTPDGRIVFSSNRLNASCGSANFDTCIFQLFAINADGSNLHALTKSSDISFAFPTVSPDGQTLAFTTFQAPNIYRIGTIPMPGNAVTTDPTEDTVPTFLTSPKTNAVWPDWSPDSAKIVFADSGCPTCPPSNIVVMTADGKNMTRLTHVRGTDNYIQPHWSPDGLKIVFTNVPTNGLPADIYTMNADGTDIESLTNSPAVYDETPSWGAAQ